MRVRPVRINLLLFCFVLLAACAAPGPKTVHKVEKDFIFATIRPGDSYRSLAAAYLNDPSKAWLIAQGNNGQDLVPGRMVVIPLRPLYRGGLKPDGYQTVPVLVYHGFSMQKADKMHVAKADFENQMNFLKDKGYSVITLDRFLDFLNFKSSIPPKSVVLTFDSGWRTVYDIAYPILKKYGYPATLFVQTDFIGYETAMSWDQVEELRDNGFDIQCHTNTHHSLAHLRKDKSFKSYFRTMDMEMSQAEEIIKRKLGVKCGCLAYPSLKTDDLFIAVLKKRGYHGAFTDRPGSNPFFVNNYAIKRSMISGGFDLHRFIIELKVFEKAELK